MTNLNNKRIKTNFKKPAYSNKLAEFVGIVLGDGGITKYQLFITLNSEADQKYIPYVSNLISNLFKMKASLYKRKNKKAIVVSVAGIRFIEYLSKLGLKKGNKVLNQVDVPNWIQRKTGYSQHCLRGLMDTDGGLFFHRYKVNGKKYKYLKLCFSNLSQPLRNFVYKTLKNSGFSPRYAGENHVWLYSQKEAKNYLKIIGSSNHRLLRKIQKQQV